MSTSHKQRGKRSLAIIEKAYRGTLEEQYGHIVWLSECMQAMGAAHSVLLRGNAVLYGVRNQPRFSLSIGDLEVRGLSHYESSITRLQASGVPVFAYEHDIKRLGVRKQLDPEISIVDDPGVAYLFADHYFIWYW